MAKYIYGTNSQLIKHQFLIQSETDTEYHVSDIDMSNYDVTFKVDKKTLKFTADNPRWQFIVNDDTFFVSFDENDVIKKSREYALELNKRYLISDQTRLENTTNELNSLTKHDEVKVTLDDFNKLNLGDEIIVIDDKGNKLIGKCCGFYTTDKVNFICDFDIQDIFTSYVKLNWNGVFVVTHEYYEYDVYEKDVYEVYLNQQHLDYVAYNRQVEKLNSIIKCLKADISRTEKKIEKLELD